MLFRSSQIPDDPEDYPRWCRYLKTYKEMTRDETVVRMEIREAAFILSDIPDKVYISLFTHSDEYMAASNMTDRPYTLVLRDSWTDMAGADGGRQFVIPPKRILFLKRNAESDG